MQLDPASPTFKAKYVSGLVGHCGKHYLICNRQQEVVHIFLKVLVLVLRRSLFIPRWFGTHCVDQAGLKFIEIYLPQLSKC